MKKLHTIILMLAAIAAAGACEKEEPLPANENNPEVVDLPQTDFSVTCVDKKAMLSGFRSNRYLTYNGQFIRERGTWNFYGHDTELVVQPNMPANGNRGNELVINVTSDDRNFRGVNISSENAAVDIVPLDDKHSSFKIVSKLSGTSNIRIWNGDGNNAVSFPIHSNIEIPLEGVQVEFDGIVYDMVQMTEKELEWAGATLERQEVFTVHPQLNGRSAELKIWPVPFNATEHTQLFVYYEESTTSMSWLLDWEEETFPDYEYNWWKYGEVSKMDIAPYELWDRHLMHNEDRAAHKFTFQKHRFDTPKEYVYYVLRLKFYN